MPDVIVVGGGVIGLSIAWELAGHGLSVRVLEQGEIGREASWAGAGMLPPGNLAGARTSEARLRGAAHQLWPEWSETLTSITGVNNGFLCCGGVEVRYADSNCERLDLTPDVKVLSEEGVVVETDDLFEIRRRFPALAPDLLAGFYLPEFRQVRNPWQIRALKVGCRIRNVELVEGTSVDKIEINGERIEAVHAGQAIHRASEYVIAGGAWTGAILDQIGIRLLIEPLKGQIVLFHASPSLFESVIQIDRKYLVPRGDGRILVGSTEERSGFDKRTSAEAIEDLIQFALRVVPSIKDAQIEKSWAGLRPFSAWGKPYIGRLPQYKNACVAAGHFRYGLHLSPITAVLIRQTLLKQPVLLPEECLSAASDLRIE